MVNGRIEKISKHHLGRALAIERFLSAQGTFGTRALPNGLFPAAGAVPDALIEMRYHFVWVRDNVHLAHWLYEIGRTEEALRTLHSLRHFFWIHKHRFLDIIDGRADSRDAMSRPHVRFDGSTLEEVDENWSHKQNDALGYFLWLTCTLLSAGVQKPSPEVLSTVALFPLYFDAIGYWKDEDSGHWEEDEAIRASSIGVALAGLTAFRRLQEQPFFEDAFKVHGVSLALVNELCNAGRLALSAILPNESIQSGSERSCDAALLFLIYPVGIVNGPDADRIIRNVRDELLGEIGIVRYRGDTFWAPDYKERVSREERTGLLKEAGERNRLVVHRGEEAQWCLFDSILSIIHGQRFCKDRRQQDLDLQIEYLNRALGQLTRPSDDFPPCRCPEAYYLARGLWVPNDATPLLWAQANLHLALRQAELSRAARESRFPGT